jgi:hypothetical protein
VAFKEGWKSIRENLFGGHNSEAANQFLEHIADHLQTTEDKGRSDTEDESKASAGASDDTRDPESDITVEDITDEDGRTQQSPGSSKSSAEESSDGEDEYFERVSSIENFFEAEEEEVGIITVYVLPGEERDAIISKGTFIHEKSGGAFDVAQVSFAENGLTLPILQGDGSSTLQSVLAQKNSVNTEIRHDALTDTVTFVQWTNLGGIMVSASRDDWKTATGLSFPSMNPSDLEGSGSVADTGLAESIADWLMTDMQGIRLGLDGVSMSNIPVVAGFADLTSAGLDIYYGDYISAGINIVSAGLNVASLHPGLAAIAITARTSLKASKAAIKAKVVVTTVIEGGVEVGKVVQRLPIGSTGKLGERELAKLGGEAQVRAVTLSGLRVIDRLTIDPFTGFKVAHESKVGYTACTKLISRQVRKDVELMATKTVDKVSWHFFISPITGLGGPTPTLYRLLTKSGIEVIVYDAKNFPLP